MTSMTIALLNTVILTAVLLIHTGQDAWHLGPYDRKETQREVQNLELNHPCEEERVTMYPPSPPECPPSKNNSRPNGHSG